MFWAFLALLLYLLTPAAIWAQAAASLSGTVLDPGGAAVVGAAVLLENELVGFRQQTSTGPNGQFLMVNLPLHPYVLTVSKEGFEPARRAVTLRSNVRETLTIDLRIAGQSAEVNVTATETTVLIQPETTGTMTELDARQFDKMPLPAGGRGIENVLLSFPGFAANANGAIHPRGAHNQMSYVIDGMPITDQLTGSFANAVDPNIAHTIELFTGNVAAEFGGKVSGVAVVTTRSGMGSGRTFSGSTTLSAAQFDMLSQVTQVAGGTDRFGYFASVNTMKSNRFLDQVSIDNLHNGGNSERAFTRLDYQATSRDTLRANLMAGRSSFELANLRSQQEAGQRQRQLLRDFAASLGWLHALDARTTIDAIGSYRTSIAQLFPSPGDTPVTASQARHLSTFNYSQRANRVQGAHTLRGGVDWQHFPVSEYFSFGVKDPGFNHPDSEDYNPSLLAFDLSRGGRLFEYAGKQSGNMLTGFVQDNVRWGRFTFALGLRYDNYRFLVTGAQWQPRVGIAFHVRETGTVLRASYNRNYQTPPNENLLLSSAPESSALAPPVIRERLNGGVVRIRPERQNVYEVGLQQAVGSKMSLNTAYYHKDSRDMQDNDNFFNTGIIFPTSLLRSRVNGFESRLNLLPVRGFSGALSMTHYRAIVTPPFTGGLFLGSAAIDALSAGPFVIDHDQKLGLHGTWQYTLPKGFWVSGAVRHDSGLVANPSDPDEVAADPDYADLLPYVNLAAWPARVRPRTVADVAIGYERKREGRRWDASFQITNLTDRTALYNFQSIFVGTRLIQPRTAALRLRFFF